MRKSVLTFLSLFLTLPYISACSEHSDKVQDNAAVSQLVTGKLSNYAAHWLTPQLLLLPKSGRDFSYSLYRSSPDQRDGVKLTAVAIPDDIKRQYPHLAALQAFSVPLNANDAKLWLKSRLVVTAQDNTTQQTQVYGVQNANLIDDLYTRGEHDADDALQLGAHIHGQQTSFQLWAPTAQQVSVLLFNKDKTPATPAQLVLSEDNNTGIWRVSSNKVAAGTYYQYKITLYHPASERVETLLSTDPYSLSLSTNSQYSQVIDLTAADTKPDGWEQQQIPALVAPEDNILYEVHIRDFSASDPTLENPAHRGKYAAFSESRSAGIKHLKQLQASGINTIHLLPSFDIATVNERPERAIDINDSLAKLCRLQAQLALCQQPGISNSQQTLAQLLAGYSKRSEQAQQLISAIRDIDDYNWGYDPYHYTVPEGSYAEQPEGKARIVEFRQMVQSLHNMGFRVVMDVVYNHTHRAGLHASAVLDKIVPNYYHRLDINSGKISQSTCCDNTATEHKMMAKLMTDSLVTWARDYKIDGFRFDLMGHQPKAVMLAARDAVRAVDPDTYFYGEGWNFGEVANNQRFVQASQLELAGTEIGTYSDRLRDAVRGPGVGASGFDIRRNQGIGNGLGTLPNELQNASQSMASYQLLSDQLRIGLAGNLANFPLTNSQGKPVLGKDIPYGAQPTGYALDPADTINYVSKHDNQTLWDNNQYRNAYALSTEQRVRLHIQSLSYTLLAQGIPFMQMGAELLRSKSFLRDSYDYGDWFNAVDFTLQHNNYDVGLPPAEKDQSNWPLIKQVLQQSAGRDHVSADDIAFSNALFNEFVQIRMSSPLFRLRNADDIIARLSFLNSGSNQQRGLIVMQLDDSTTSQSLDSRFQKIVVIFNANDSVQHFHYGNAAEFTLHPVQQQSRDSTIKQSLAKDDEFTVPALSTSVFVLARH